MCRNALPLAPSHGWLAPAVIMTRPGRTVHGLVNKYLRDQASAPPPGMPGSIARPVLHIAAHVTDSAGSWATLRTQPLETPGSLPAQLVRPNGTGSVPPCHL